MTQRPVDEAITDWRTDPALCRGLAFLRAACRDAVGTASSSRNLERTGSDRIEVPAARRGETFEPDRSGPWRARRSSCTPWHLWLQFVRFPSRSGGPATQESIGRFSGSSLPLN